MIKFGMVDNLNTPPKTPVTKRIHSDDSTTSAYVKRTRLVNYYARPKTQELRRVSDVVKGT